MNRQEREDYVIRLYEEGKTSREIAKLARMSFRDIGAIIKKLKLQAERERGYINEDTEAKSPEAQAFKLFSEGKSPIEVEIALDEPGDRVRYMHREYLELTGRYKLAQIYDEARYDLPGLIRLHKIVSDLGMKEHDIRNVLELVKYNELQNLQWKVEYLGNEVNNLQVQKSKASNQILELNRIVDQLQSSLPPLKYINQESEWYDVNNLYSAFPELYPS